MRWRYTATSVLITLLFPLLLFGQITITPSKASVGQKVVATVSATVPEGATFDGGWSASCTAGTCRVELEDLKKPYSVGLWGPAGEYTLEYSGFWLLLKEVSFVDGEGNQVVIQSYLGHGFIREKAVFTLEDEQGPDPPQPPDPPTPDPDGPWKVWFVEDPGQRDNLPKEQMQLLTSLVYRQRLEALGHTYEETVPKSIINSPPERLLSIAQAAKDKPLPLVVIQSQKEPGVILSTPLPADYETLAKMLEDPK